MTTDNRTPAEIRYDAERDGSAYVKPTAQPYNPWDDIIDTLLDNPSQDIPLSDDERAILEHLQARQNQRESEDVQFGQLADGTPMMGSFGGGERSGVVYINTPSWSLHADDDGMIAGGNKRNTIAFEELTYQDVIALRALVASDAFERLYAAAVAWGRGDAAAPSAA